MGTTWYKFINTHLSQHTHNSTCTLKKYNKSEKITGWTSQQQPLVTDHGFVLNESSRNILQRTLSCK